MPDHDPGEEHRILTAIANAADEHSWCLQFPCTTCATEDVRGEITRWVLLDPASFVDELGRVGFHAYERGPSLGPCVGIALGQLDTLDQPRLDRYTRAFVEHVPAGGSVVDRVFGTQVQPQRLTSMLRDYRQVSAGRLQSAILEAWLDDASAESIRALDGILFYRVRSLADERVRNLWFAKGAELAVETGDVSLHETLVWSLGPAIRLYPQLLASLRRRRDDPLIARALRETGAGVSLD